MSDLITVSNQLNPADAAEVGMVAVTTYHLPNHKPKSRVLGVEYVELDEVKDADAISNLLNEIAQNKVACRDVAFIEDKDEYLTYNNFNHKAKIAYTVIKIDDVRVLRNELKRCYYAIDKLLERVNEASYC